MSMTIEQAVGNIDAVLREVRNPPLNRAEDAIMQQSLQFLYKTAKDAQELEQRASIVEEPQ